MPDGTGLGLPAQPVVEASIGIELEGPEAKVAMTRGGEARGQAAEQQPANATAIVVGRDIEAIDLGGIGVGVAFGDRLVPQRRTAAADAEDLFSLGRDQVDGRMRRLGKALLPLGSADIDAVGGGDPVRNEACVGLGPSRHLNSCHGLGIGKLGFPHDDQIVLQP
jgi:hypothetical protein